MDLEKTKDSMLVLKQVSIVQAYDEESGEMLFVNKSIHSYELDMIDGGRSGILRLEHDIFDKQLIKDFTNGNYARRVLRLRLVGIGCDTSTPNLNTVSVIAEIDKSVLETVTDREAGNYLYDEKKERSRNKLVFYIDFYKRDYVEKKDIWSPIRINTIENGDITI